VVRAWFLPQSSFVQGHYGQSDDTNRFGQSFERTGNESWQCWPRSKADAPNARDFPYSASGRKQGQGRRRAEQRQVVRTPLQSEAKHIGIGCRPSGPIQSRLCPIALITMPDL
jgi:hypothetical protein